MLTVGYGFKCTGWSFSKDFMSIRGHFQSSNIIHVRRQGNNVAHALARDARFSFPFKGLDGGSSSKYLLLRCKRFALVF